MGSWQIELLTCLVHASSVYSGRLIVVVSHQLNCHFGERFSQNRTLSKSTWWFHRQESDVLQQLPEEPLPDTPSKEVKAYKWWKRCDVGWATGNKQICFKAHIKTSISKTTMTSCFVSCFTTSWAKQADDTKPESSTAAAATLLAFQDLEVRLHCF